MSVDPAVRLDLLPYVGNLATRTVRRIDLVVIHCTELPDLATARRFGQQIRYAESETGNSGHFYIDRDGSIWQYVPIDRVAHHTRGCNDRSVGIELVNSGRYPDWLDSRRQAMNEPYAQAQVDALVALLQSLQSQLDALRWIAGHEEMDTGQVAASDDAGKLVRRKRDPGPMFPWDDVLGRIRLRRFAGDFNR